MEVITETILIYLKVFDQVFNLLIINQIFIFQSWTVNKIQCGRTNLSSVPREIPMDASSVHLDGNQLSLLPPESFLGRSRLVELYLNSSQITGLSAGTFLGLTVLAQLDLSHNLLVQVLPAHLAGLESLEVLELHHNRLERLHTKTFTGMTRLRVLSLHHNQLAVLSLDLSSGLQEVSLHHNRWRCRAKEDCAWVRQVMERPDNYSQLTCLTAQHTTVRLGSFVSSCTNLDVLPVSAQTSSSSSSLVMLFIILLAALVLVTAAITATVVVRHLVAGLSVRVYLHYSSQDEALVRAEVGREVGRVVSSLCYHHTDLSTQLSVGQAISAAVSSTAALVITASPAYTQSAITTAELNIIAGCVQQQLRPFPVIVLVTAGQSVSQVILTSDAAVRIMTLFWLCLTVFCLMTSTFLLLL